MVVHLASAGVSPQQASWEELYQINVAAGIELIQLAHKPAGVLYRYPFEYGSESDAWDRISPHAPLRPTTHTSQQSCWFSMPLLRLLSRLNFMGEFSLHMEKVNYRQSCGHRCVVQHCWL